MSRAAVTETFADAQGDKPEYALDVAGLGGMYAKKIVMVGTEKGVGVRNAGELGAGVGELSLSAAGRLENRGSMQSQETLALAGEGDVINTGCLITHSNARLSAAETLFNTGSLRAGGDITLDAKRVDMTGDSLLSAGSDAQGQLTRAGNLMMTSQGPLIAQGYNQATGALMVCGSEVDLAGSRTSGTDIMLSANQGTLCTDGAQVCGGKITARAATSFTNNNGRLSANMLTLVAQEISNRLGTLEQRGDDLLQLKVHQLNNHQGLVSTNGDMLIRTAWVDNRGGRIIVNGPNLSLRTKILDNQGGTIKLLGNGRMALTAERLNDYQGILWSTGAMLLTGEQLDLTQSVTRAQSLSLTATHLQHQRRIMWQLGAGQMKLLGSGEADNRGVWIQSGGALWLKSGYLNNPGGTRQPFLAGRARHQQCLWSPAGQP
ncbi:hypothetical protein JZM24_14995 [Candidatus Sodalis endolongispinus]|uniref:Uncharacterized protein n=1 Tax=Candidatus Sodalis endolongispinus TaxID=2812662 RepID=A0ABS5YDS3_9GAMM|nr:hypothetical protein [Candidatus Sodalis endolongispinus]MBT9433099.1 hypothetical protein [Candidatus Sodalis endolongispinus]